MIPKINLLVIDDHPIVVRGYKTVLENFKNSYLEVDEAHNIDDALFLLNNESSVRPYDVIILDIRLPPSKKYPSLISGEDLGRKIKKTHKATKIIVITALNDNYRISCLLKYLDPDGLLIKCDLSEEVLHNAVTAVVQGNTYYSRQVSKLIRKRNTTDIYLDDMDRRILFLLSNGEKTKDMPNLLPLSLASIQRKKKRLKMCFEVDGSGGNRELLLKAKEMGFI
ncbi:response regulator [Ulvibacterium sp.]|uniref:response regulator n=1 Tax=Ulvibacterium sp. TaxID=2665914 RepID=UPI003BABF453